MLEYLAQRRLLVTEDVHALGTGEYQRKWRRSFFGDLDNNLLKGLLLPARAQSDEGLEQAVLVLILAFYVVDVVELFESNSGLGQLVLCRIRSHHNNEII